MQNDFLQNFELKKQCMVLLDYYMKVIFPGILQNLCVRHKLNIIFVYVVCNRGFFEIRDMKRILRFVSLSNLV